MIQFLKKYNWDAIPMEVFKKLWEDRDAFREELAEHTRQVSDLRYQLRQAQEIEIMASTVVQKLDETRWLVNDIPIGFNGSLYYVCYGPLVERSRNAQLTPGRTDEHFHLILRAPLKRPNTWTIPSKMDQATADEIAVNFIAFDQLPTVLVNGSPVPMKWGSSEPILPNPSAQVPFQVRVAATQRAAVEQRLAERIALRDAQFREAQARVIRDLANAPAIEAPQDEAPEVPLFVDFNEPPVV